MNRNKSRDSGYSKIMDALQGVQSSTIPFGLVLSLYGKNYVKCSLKEYYTNSECYVDGQIAIVAKFDPDIVTTPFVLSYEGEVFGSSLKYFDNAPPQIKKCVITDFREIIKLKVPPVNTPLKNYIFETVELLSDKYKKDKLIAGLTLSNIDTPAMIMGIEGWIDTLLFHPEEARVLMQKTTEYFIEYSNTLFSKGIDVLVVPNMFSNPSIITKKIMNEITLDFFAQALKNINGPVIIHHGGARLSDFLHYYTDLPNVIGFAIDASDCLTSSREVVGSKLLLGNLDMKIIFNRTSEIIARNTKTILESMKDDFNYIFFNSNADIMLETPEENIEAVCNTIKQFNR